MVVAKSAEGGAQPHPLPDGSVKRAVDGAEEVLIRRYHAVSETA